MGRLTREPEVRYTSTKNTLVVNFGLAVNRRIAKQGEERQADFFNVVAWDKTGEFCSKYIKKGQQIAVTGRLQTRNYDDLDGKKVFMTEVVAEEVFFAENRREQNSAEANSSEQNIPAHNTQEFVEVTDDDLPF